MSEENNVVNIADQYGAEALNKVPEHLRGGIERYVENRIEAGGFLTKVFENDLFGAMGQADMNSRAGLFEVVNYIYNHCPSSCHGSPEKVTAWLDRKDCPNPSLEWRDE